MKNHETFQVSSITSVIINEDERTVFFSLIISSEVWKSLKKLSPRIKMHAFLAHSSTDVPCHIPQATAAFPPDCPINHALAFLHKLHPYFIRYPFLTLVKKKKKSAGVRFWIIHSAVLHSKGQLREEVHDTASAVASSPARLFFRLISVSDSWQDLSPSLHLLQISMCLRLSHLYRDQSFEFSSAAVAFNVIPSFMLYSEELTLFKSHDRLHSSC